MSTSYTTNALLQKPARSDRNWDTPLSANFDAIDAMSAIGRLLVTPTEVPSTTLHVRVTSGTFRKSDGTLVSYGGTSSQALTGSATNYLYLTDAGVLTVNTTGFPATFHVRLATVVTTSSAVSTVTDSRVFTVSSGGSNNSLYLTLAANDSGGVVTVNLGTTNGTILGGGATDKLAFWGATPATQPANTVEIVSLLSAAGLRATGGNPPLNLGSGAVTCGALNAGGTVTVTDAQNVVVGTTTGTKFGTAANQKIGFFGATPAAQPSGANEAAVGALTTATLTDGSGGTASTSIATISDSATANAVASLAAQVNHAAADLGSLKTLVNQLRADLVTLGLIKGSA
jgi:hypothetical protein